MDNGAIDHNVAPSPRIVPHLVGRAREQAALRDALAATINGHGQLVLVGGEAGIGKTSLARDLSREAAAVGCRVLTGSCYDLSNTPPYGPWLNMFEECQRDRGLPAPPPAFATSANVAITDQAALFAEVRRFLATLAASDPALLLLEDLHWADPASLDLLRHLGPHLRHWPILLIATYRDDELGHGHPLARQIPALVREADAHRVDVHRLDRGALRALVAGRYSLARPDVHRLVAYLERHAEGNPLFATELLRTLEEGRLLRRDGNAWELEALDRVIVPSLLRQVIEGRITRLGEETRRHLAIAAVIGQEVPLELWAAVAELDEDALLDVVERAVEAHLLEAERDGTRVHFIHALTREALYEGVLPPRRRVWHQRVAEALLASTDPDADAVAYHLQASGDPRAAEWLVKAADRAQHAYAFLTAGQRLRAATALLEGLESEAGARAWLLLRLAHFERFSDPASDIPLLHEAERLAAHVSEAALAGEVHYTRGLFLCYANQFREGLATMLGGIDELEAINHGIVRNAETYWDRFVMAFAGTVSPTTPDDELAVRRLQHAGIESRRGVSVWFLGLAGQPCQAIEVGERFLSVLAPGPGVTEGARYAVAFAEHGLGIAYAALGRPDEARQSWKRSRATFFGFGHHMLVAFSHCFELWDGVYPFAADQPAVRRRYAAEAEAAMSRAGGALPPGFSPRVAWLSCFLLDGRWAEALAILQDLPLPANSCLRREVTGPHATIARRQGDAETAWSQILPLFPEGPATEPGDIIHQEGLVLQRLAAELCLDVGNVEGAKAWLEAHERWLAWSESVLGQADGRLAWARWHLAAGNPDQARIAASEALALAESPCQPLVTLGGHRLLGEIATGARDFSRAERHLTSALELAMSCETPFERALTLLALAEIRAVQGEHEEARRLLDEVRALCLPLGAAPTLARIDALAPRLAATRQTEMNAYGLTQREFDVLRLVVAGRSNQAIADELFISRDTARTHVANIFRKLDVSSRAEAVDSAHRHGLLSVSPSSST